MDLLERAKKLREDAENTAKAMEAYESDPKVEIEFRISNVRGNIPGSWTKCCTPYWAVHCDYRIKPKTPLNREQLKALIGTVIVGTAHGNEFYVQGVVDCLDRIRTINIPKTPGIQPHWEYIDSKHLVTNYTSKAGIQLYR